MIKRVIAFLLTAAGLAFGQATTNSITVTASRNANVQPDQVVFGVKVDAPLTASRDDAVSALQGSGITLANLTGVTTVQQYDSKGQATVSLIEWTFSLPVAIADMKSTIALLSTVQTSNAQKNNGIAISFGVQGTQVSPQAQQALSCALSDLIGDANAQAQKMASAAGKGLGPLLAMGSATVASTPGVLFASPVYTPVCSLTVKYQLTGF
ncbi:MAG TPA: SIMPL domain-containing protein [Bryobacteraceae bacterium]|nr:SIMPL domain-containing protein [Bryobacteraceae bacterium]